MRRYASYVSGSVEMLSEQSFIKKLGACWKNVACCKGCRVTQAARFIYFNFGGASVTLGNFTLLDDAPAG